MFMKRVLSLCLAVLLGLVCFGAYFREEMPVGSVGTGIAVGTSAIPPKVLHKIRITAGEDVVYGVLYDTPCGRGISQQLPITKEITPPADFAKAFVLDERIESDEELTSVYVPGGLAYWPTGNAVAIFHAPERDMIDVPIIHFGKIDEGEEIFAEYDGEITIERYDESETEE